MDKIEPKQLTGVSETALWTLWNRGSEARRPDRTVDDPLAVELIERIDYPYRQRFGVASQVVSMRAHAFDGVVRTFLESHPRATVVALGEGLQTSYWRLGRPAATWITVDLAPIVALREQLLPGEQHIINFAGSALDRSWMNMVPSESSPIIVAEGLFMYFDETTVYELISDCARQFPGGTLVFDAAPHWFARMKVKTVGARRDASTKERYIAPPILSGISAKDAAALATHIDGVASSQAVQMPPGRGLQGWLLRAIYQGRLIPARWRMPLYVLRFKSTTGDR
jgi:O-methyltransferase involved in polyketide biosynthesis